MKKFFLMTMIYKKIKKLLWVYKRFDSYHADMERRKKNCYNLVKLIEVSEVLILNKYENKAIFLYLI